MLAPSVSPASWTPELHLFPLTVSERTIMCRAETCWQACDTDRVWLQLCFLFGFFTDRHPDMCGMMMKVNHTSSSKLGVENKVIH